jgi:hypothetical protein
VAKVKPHSARFSASRSTESVGAQPGSTSPAGIRTSPTSAVVPLLIRDHGAALSRPSRRRLANSRPTRAVPRGADVAAAMRTSGSFANR